MITHQYKEGITQPRNLLTKDHLQPRTYGGLTIYDNLIAACSQCNNLRGEMEAQAFFNLQQKWFRRDVTLRARWHTISREELYDLKTQCLQAHERQLRGLAMRNIEYAFRHFKFICCQKKLFRRA
ncbi:HNH endonuclease [Patescibacteria group bacterium]|nr:HNH endonuclease [Patescibacteria group bacterium]